MNEEQQKKWREEQNKWRGIKSNEKNKGGVKQNERSKREVKKGWKKRRGAKGTKENEGLYNIFSAHLKTEKNSPTSLSISNHLHTRYSKLIFGRN